MHCHKHSASAHKEIWHLDIYENIFYLSLSDDTKQVKIENAGGGVRHRLDSMSIIDTLCKRFRTKLDDSYSYILCLPVILDRSRKTGDHILCPYIAEMKHMQPEDASRACQVQEQFFICCWVDGKNIWSVLILLTTSKGSALSQPACIEATFLTWVVASPSCCVQRR